MKKNEKGCLVGVNFFYKSEIKKSVSFALTDFKSTKQPNLILKKLKSIWDTIFVTAFIEDDLVAKRLRAFHYYF
ncbi:hypothetical protein C4F50_22060 [Flavobacterium sp. KB82]|uniref:Uncharacterized protein n=1 Tax=Flavobacterium hungaricum TaxID=2082725 RepID=A0ABR9TRC5_9FLAO|nr:hypothetical protein [Flavobacterium hungaricum]